MSWKKELHEAVENNNFDTFNACLNRVEVQTELPNVHEWLWEDDEAPFHFSIAWNRVKFVRALVEKGININSYRLKGW